jgi:hypothetical protein
MPSRIAGVALAAVVVLIFGATSAAPEGADQSRYPDWKGQWVRDGSGQGAPWDPSRPAGRGQNAPLTAEYQAIFEANLEDQAAGGQGTDPSYRCIPAGMPRVMIAVQPMEIVTTPHTTYILLELFTTLRRVYTDGRDWPKHIEPSFAGYSIGRWEDTDGDGRYDTLHIETRAIKGPRSYDSSGVPLHKDGKSIIFERISLDRSKPGMLQNVVTTHDNALTRPWTVTRTYRRTPQNPPFWSEYICAEDNRHVQIGDQNYVIDGDGLLMPVRKGQPPPDLRHFNPTPK